MKLRTLTMIVAGLWTLPAAAGFQDGLIGLWVPERTGCPSAGAPLPKQALRIQREAIDLADRQCWLTNEPETGETLSVDTICRLKKRTPPEHFTFKRLSDTSWEIRIGRRKRTYVRCTDTWEPDPAQQAAALRLVGLSFNILVPLTLTTRVGGGPEHKDEQLRVYDFGVDATGTMDDTFVLNGTRIVRKTFRARFGEVVRDSDSDRVAWSVEDGRLVRQRERIGYYERISWPLKEDGAGLGCKLSIDHEGKPGIRRLVTTTVSGKTVEILWSQWKGATCTTRADRSRAGK